MRMLLGLLATLWIATDVVAAQVSAHRRLPYDLGFLDAPGSPGQVTHDWLLGWGTGLAAPVAAAVGVLLLALVARAYGGAGRAGRLLLAALAGAVVAWTLANRPTHDVVADPGSDRLATALVAVSLASAALLGVVALAGFLGGGGRERP